MLDPHASTVFRAPRALPVEGSAPAERAARRRNEASGLPPEAAGTGRSAPKTVSIRMDIRRATPKKNFNSGPAGDLPGITGKALFSGYNLPTVVFPYDESSSTQAIPHFARPESGVHPEGLAVEVAGSRPDGRRGVTVPPRNGPTVVAITQSVARLPLSVASSLPERRDLRRHSIPVLGRGIRFGALEVRARRFGARGATPEFRNHRITRARGWFDPHPGAAWKARPVRHPDRVVQEASAGGKNMID